MIRFLFLALLFSQVVYSNPIVSSNLTIPLSQSQNEELFLIKELIHLTNLHCRSTSNFSSVVQCIQKWRRPLAQERWEVKVNQDYEKKRKEMMSVFSRLNMFKEEQASKHSYDYAIVLGCNALSMQRRLHWLVDQLERGVMVKNIVFLVSDRPRNERIENDRVLLQEMSRLSFSKKGAERINSVKTENEFAHFFYEHSSLSTRFKSIRVMFVNTPLMLGTRPNTAMTVKRWLKKKKPASGSVLVLSNPPYIGYQDAVVRRCLPRAFQVETIGGPSVYSESMNIAVLLDTLAKWMYEKQQVVLKNKGFFLSK